MDSKQLALIAAIALALSGTIMSLQTTNSENMVNNFEAFKVKHGKSYESELENNYRLSIYSANMADINAHNSQNGVSYLREENQFTDITGAEFMGMYLMKEKPERSSAPEYTNEHFVGDVNWVTAGKVQSVKNQGQCGSCWAFSTVAVSESQQAIREGTIGNFAEQQLVDCDSANSGCSGGWPYKALDYLSSHGFCEEDSYTYTAVGGSCKESSCTKSSFRISGHQSIAASVNSLKSANDASPVSVCVDASKWSSYASGIFNDCSTSIDHAVLLAGYTSDYWLIKNSWGSTWGENGYIRLAGSANTCGITGYAVVPS